MDTQVRGWLLAVCPILMMVMWMVVGPDTSDMKPAEELRTLSEQGGRARIAILGGTFAMVGFVIGLALLARAMRGPEKPGSIWAEISGILFLVLIAVATIGTGYVWAAMQEFETDKVLAEAMVLNGEGAGQMVGVIWSLGILFQGIAVVLQKRFHVAIGYITIVLSALVFIYEITEEGLLGGVLGLGWPLLIVVAVTMGVLTIIRKERQWQSQPS